MRFPLIGPAYTSQSPAADSETLVNWYVERMESRGARTEAVLYPRPGLSEFAEVVKESWNPTPAIRGGIVVQGTVFVVAGTELHRIAPDGSKELVSIVADDLGPVSFAAGPAEVMLISAGIVYWIPLSGAPVLEATELANEADTYDLEWSINNIDATSWGVACTLTATGNTITATVDLSGESETAQKMLSRINEVSISTGEIGITVSGASETGYNGAWEIFSVDASDLSAVEVRYLVPVGGFAPDSGVLTWYAVRIAADVGVAVQDGDRVTVADTTNTDWERTYTVALSLGQTASAPVLYCFMPFALLDGGSLTSSADGAAIVLGHTPKQIVFLGGYFILFYEDSQWFRISGLFNGLSWDALDMARISLFPDNIVSMVVDHLELWLLCEHRSIVYVNTGNADFPLEPVLSALIEQGSAAAFSPANLDNSIFWLGKDARGQAVAYRANGYLPVRVSTHAVEQEWQQYATVADAESFSLQWHGHNFWVVYFPTADKTWVYDAATGTWSQWLFWDADAEAYTAFRGRCHVFAFGKHLIGDWHSGPEGDEETHLWEMSGAVYTDFGNAIRRERAAGEIHAIGKRVFFRRAEIYLESGLGMEPEMATINNPSFEADVLADGASDSTPTGWEVVNGQVRNPTPGSFLSVPEVPDGDNVAQMISGPSAGTFTQVLALTIQAGYRYRLRWYQSAPSGVIDWCEAVVSMLYGPNSGSMTQLIAGSFTVGQAWIDQSLDYTAPFSGPMIGEPLIIRFAGGSILNLAQTSIDHVRLEVYAPPALSLEWSDDRGHTYPHSRTLYAGFSGDYNKRLYANRLGSARQRRFRIVSTSPYPWRIIDGWVDAEAER